MTNTKKKSSKWIIWALVGLLVILIIGAAIKARKKPKGETVESEKIILRDIREIVSASGKIFPEKEVKISSDVSGEIVELTIKEGDSIKAGQVLARIDQEAYASAVESAGANVNVSKSELSRSKSAVDNAKAQVEQMKSQVDAARRTNDRNKKLRADGVISAQDMENSQSTLDQLEANLRSADASYQSAVNGAKSAEYSVASSQANYKEISTNLHRTTILAPTSGIVSKLNVEKGERVVGTIQMTGTEMMRIANFNSMEVQVEVSENDILRVSVGDTADIEVDAYLDKKFKGVVTEMASSAANTGTGVEALTSDQVTNFIVKIRILQNSYANLDDKRMPFRPGMSASVDINTNTERAVIAIPIQSVTTREKDGEKKDSSTVKKSIMDDEIDEVVFVIDADTAKMVKVKTGIQDNEYIQVLDGLTVGDEVITGPYSTVSRKLKNGLAVERKKKAEKDNKDSTDKKNSDE
ncbi:MAG TPA: efflux RND transporter periplasmic adaptor subunit [Saprospiraceae bacterium]|nr:efflux RND transporter periplasmic adaptor subunit [Saprospiraceae bacterium]